MAPTPPRGASIAGGVGVIHRAAARLRLLDDGGGLSSERRRELGLVLLLEACLVLLERGCPVSCSALVAALAAPGLPVAVRADALTRLDRAAPRTWLVFVLSQVSRRFLPGAPELLDAIPESIALLLRQTVALPAPGVWAVEAAGVLGDACLPLLEPLAGDRTLTRHLAIALRHSGPSRWELLSRDPSTACWATLRETDQERPIPYRMTSNRSDRRGLALEALAEEFLRDAGASADVRLTELRRSCLAAHRDLAVAVAGRLGMSERQAPASPGLTETTRALERIAGSPDGDERRRAAEALSEAGERGLPLLAKLAKDPFMRVRAAAARALGGLGPPALSCLKALAIDPADEVRAAVCASIPVEGADAAALDLLAELMEDPSPVVREEAFGALAGFDPLAHLRPLRHALSCRPAGTQVAILRGLCRSGAPLLPFVQQHSTESPRVRAWLRRARLESDWGLPGHVGTLEVPSLGAEPVADPPEHLPIEGTAWREALVRHIEEAGPGAGSALCVLSDPRATPSQIERVRAVLASAADLNVWLLSRFADGSGDDHRARGGEGEGVQEACRLLARHVQDAARSPESRRRACRALLLEASRMGPAGRPILARLAGSPDPGVRTLAAETLGTLGSSALPHLEVLARDRDEFVRCAALEALHQAAARDRLEPVLRRLADDELPGVRAALARSLASGGPEDLPMLERLASDRSPQVRAAVAAALPVAGVDALPTLARLVLDSCGEDYIEAVCAALQLGPPGWALLEEEDLPWNSEVVVQALARAGPASQSLLEELWSRTPTQEQGAVLRALGRLGPEGLPPLRRLTQSELIAAHPPSRELGRTLLEILDSPSLPQLRRQAGDEDHVVRGLVGRAMSQLGQRGLGLAEDLAVNQDPKLRSTAACALRWVSVQRPHLALLERLARDPDSRVHEQAIGALADGRHRPVLESIATFCHRSNLETAMLALGDLRSAAQPFLIGALDNEDVRIWAAAALRRSGVESLPRAVVQRLADDAEGRYPSSRVRLAGALPALGPGALPFLERLLTDAATEVREAAARSLEELGPQGLPLVRRLAQDDRPDQRLLAVSSVGPLAAWNRPVIEALARDPAPEVRRKLAYGLDQGVPGELGILCEMASDRDGGVVCAVANAAVEHGGDGLVLLERIVAEGGNGVALSSIDRAILTGICGQVGPLARHLLESIVSNPDYREHRVAALVALRGMGDEVAPLLEGLVADRDWTTRQAAAPELLNSSEDRTATLVDLAQSGHGDVRSFAFGELQSSSATSTLRSLCDHDREEVHQEALDVLFQLGGTNRALLAQWSTTPRRVGRAYERRRPEYRAYQRRRPEYLEERARTETDPAERAAAWLLLSHLRAERALAMLRELDTAWLEGLAQEPIVQQAPDRGRGLELAARACFGTVEVRELCGLAVRERRRWLRRLSLALLERTPDPPALGWWRDRLHDERVPALRRMVLRVVSRLGDRDAVRSALATDQSPTVRCTAAELLGQGGDPESGPALVDAARADPDPSVRAAAIGSLVRRNDLDGLWALLELPGRSDAGAVRQLLTESAPRLDRLVRALATRDSRLLGSWDGWLPYLIGTCEPVLDAAFRHGVAVEDVALLLSPAGDHQQPDPLDQWQEKLYRTEPPSDRWAGILLAGLAGWKEESEVAKVVEALRHAPKVCDAPLARDVVRLLECRHAEMAAFQVFHDELISADGPARVDHLVRFGARWKGANLRRQQWANIARRLNGASPEPWIRRIWRSGDLAQGLALVRSADKRRRPRADRIGRVRRVAAATEGVDSEPSEQGGVEPSLAWLMDPRTPAQEIVAIRKGLRAPDPPILADLPGAARALAAARPGEGGRAEPPSSPDGVDWAASDVDVISSLTAVFAQPIDDVPGAASLVDSAIGWLGTSTRRRRALRTEPAHLDWKPLVRWMSSLDGEEELALCGPLASPAVAARVCDQQLKSLAYGAPEAATALLRYGAGSLDAGDYPHIRLTCRPGVRAVSPRTARRLEVLADAWREDLERLAAATSLTQVLGAGEARALHGPLLALERDVRAWCTLRFDVLAADPGQVVRRRHLKRFWRRVEQLSRPAPVNLEEVRERFGLDALVAGIVGALQIIVRSAADRGHPLRGDAGVSLLRRTAVLFRPPTQVSEAPAALADLLFHASEVAPEEVARAIGLPEGDHLPTLGGGAKTPWENAVGKALSDALGGAMGLDGEASLQHFDLRPIDKLQALSRGDLGGDCSSSAVPLRALLPHRTYYGVFQGAEQRRGYLGVFEATARFPDGRNAPVLCLETINVPIRVLDSVQLDLLWLLESVAVQRGVEPGLVVVTGCSTWNYANAETITASRRFKRGTRVLVGPVDPAVRWVYDLATDEAGIYDPMGTHQTWLAPFDPDSDVVLAENIAEARRIRDLG